MIKTVTALKARQNLGQLLEEVYYKGDQYIIERSGKPMAAVVPISQLDEWLNRRGQFFEKIETVWARNQNVDSEEIEAAVAEAVHASRTKPSEGNDQSRS